MTLIVALATPSGASEMGWVHAALTILAVVGAPPAVLSLLSLLGIYWPDVETVLFYDILDALTWILILAPAPAVVGITIWRKRVFGEQPRADGRMSLPAMTAVAILGMWWLLPISSMVRYWIGW